MIDMKSIKRYLFSLLVFFVSTSVFVSCSKDQIVSLDEDTSIQETIDEELCKVSSSQINKTDYEIIPIGTNNYVYVPKMTSTKSVTRSTETTKTYSATIISDIITEEFGTLSVTITWDKDGASYRLSDCYMFAHQYFNYTINGSSITIDGLCLRIYGSSGGYVDTFNYVGSLSGS